MSCKVDYDGASHSTHVPRYAAVNEHLSKGDFVARESVRLFVEVFPKLLELINLSVKAAAIEETSRIASSRNVDEINVMSAILEEGRCKTIGDVLTYFTAQLVAISLDNAENHEWPGWKIPELEIYLERYGRKA
jgi:hypothetical protein